MTACCDSITVVRQAHAVAVQPIDRSVAVQPVELRLITTPVTPATVSVLEQQPNQIGIDTIPSTTSPTPRVGVALLGVMDGANKVFTASDAFVASGGYAPGIYYNGQRLVVADYSLSEGSGVGTGHNTVTLGFPPCDGDSLTSDYYLA